jgi:hypothetical protein
VSRQARRGAGPLLVNMKAGEPPAPDEAGKRFLKVPINGL